jgi:hypothetical protein
VKINKLPAGEKQSTCRISDVDTKVEKERVYGALVNLFQKKLCHFSKKSEFAP